MFERGDLLLVPFPFSDLSATKRRPVLALTAPDEYGDFIALPVTSRLQAERGVPLTSAGLLSGALPVPSWIRTDRIVTLRAFSGKVDTGFPQKMRPHNESRALSDSI